MNLVTSNSQPNGEYIIRYATLKNGIAIFFNEGGWNFVFRTYISQSMVLKSLLISYLIFKVVSIDDLLNPWTLVCVVNGSSIEL